MDTVLPQASSPEVKKPSGGGVIVGEVPMCFTD